jgi:hypothetical protein
MFRPLGQTMASGPKHVVISFKELINTVVLRRHYTLHLYQYSYETFGRLKMRPLGCLETAHMHICIIMCNSFVEASLMVVV